MMTNLGTLRGADIPEFHPQPYLPELTIDASIGRLSLHRVYLGSMDLGKAAEAIFTDRALLPGIILLEGRQLVGMISRQHFFSRMSQPYSLELFLKRPLKEFYDFVTLTPLILPSNMPIGEAAQRSLQRSTDCLYEPILVQCPGADYALLDIHQLLLAQSEVHRLTTVRLNERTQAYLYQTEKMSMLGQTVAGVSHEIKNPVNCIEGNLGFLKEYTQQVLELLELYKTEFPEINHRIKVFEDEIDIEFLLTDLPKMLESIDLASSRLVNIVSSLRNFSRLDQEQRELIDIHKYLDGTLLILNSEIKQGINVIKVYGDIPRGACYPGQISQVFMNLISNSIDAGACQVCNE